MISSVFSLIALSLNRFKLGFELFLLLTKEEFELQKQLDFVPLLKDEEAELKKQEGAKREAVAIANQQFSLCLSELCPSKNK